MSKKEMQSKETENVLFQNIRIQLPNLPITDFLYLFPSKL
jgi:hypothetical protein